LICFGFSASDFVEITPFARQLSVNCVPVSRKPLAEVRHRQPPEKRPNTITPGTMDRLSPDLPPIPDKRYFTIGEVSELCLVKPYVLRYWEQEFVQLRPMKRRGNRRYYQHHEVLLVRRIRELLYEKGFTISGARNRLTEMGPLPRGDVVLSGDPLPDDIDVRVSPALLVPALPAGGAVVSRALQASAPAVAESAWAVPDLDVGAFQQLPPDAIGPLRDALLSIRDLLA